MEKFIMSKYKCYCDACNSKLSFGKSEQQLHTYIGSNAFNLKCELEDFEKDFEFGSVIHWNVGYTTSPRYFVYLNSMGECIAWHDNVNQIGYK